MSSPLASPSSSQASLLNTVAFLQSSVEATTNIINSINTQIDVNKTLEARQKELLAQLQIANTERDEARSETIRAQKELSDLKLQHAKDIRRLETLYADPKQAMKDLKDAKEQHRLIEGIYKMALGRSNRALRQVKAELHTKEKMLSASEKELIQLKHAISNLRHLMQDALRAKEEVTHELETSKGLAGTWNRKVEMLQDEVECLEDALSKCENRERETVDEWENYTTSIIADLQSTQRETHLYNSMLLKMVNELEDARDLCKCTALQEENEELKTQVFDLKDEINWKQPLVDVGIAVRLRNILLIHQNNDSYSPTDKEKELIAQGEYIAYKGDGRADEGLFLSGKLDLEKWAPIFKSVYLKQPGCFSSLRAKPTTFWNTYATFKSIIPHEFTSMTEPILEIGPHLRLFKLTYFGHGMTVDKVDALPKNLSFIDAERELEEYFRQRVDEYSPDKVRELKIKISALRRDLVSQLPFVKMGIEQLERELS